MASGGFDAHAKTTRKAAFVARMDKLMPWPALVALIEPHYPKAGNGRPPRSMSSMLRMYCIANWFNLANEACEDALYDIEAFRDFCGVDMAIVPIRGKSRHSKKQPQKPKTSLTNAPTATSH